MLNLREPKLFRTQAYVGGRWMGADDGATVSVRNPADGAALADVPLMGAAETRKAIAAAEAALPAWRALPAKERSGVLWRWADLMLANQDDLALILTSEQGKPLAEAKGEIAYAASFFHWFAEEAKRVYGDVIPATSTDRRLLVIKQPVGVTAGITPWNFPAAMITRKAGPALAAGCTMVVKPAEQTPLSALALCELGERAGLPPGVFNVVTSDGPSAPAVGKELTANPAVRKIGFTGSTEVGKILMAQCAPGLKKVSLELGGNAPFIVFDDADVEAAVEGAIVSKFRNSGQTCVCTNRFFVQEGVWKRFTERFVERVRALRVGSGIEPGAQIGPLIDQPALAKVERHVADAVHRGATVLTGGGRSSLGGTFFEPTVIADVPSAAAMHAEETFGPLAGLTRFSREEEAVAMANDTTSGLASYFYARDIGRIWRVAEALEYGMVGVNTGLISTEVAPFGGVKESGFGREGSKYGIEDWLEIKYVAMAGI